MKILTIALFFLLTACSSVPVATTDIKTAAEPPTVPVAVAPPVTAAPPVTTVPNFLLIISDDQRYDTMKYMPLTVNRIFHEGVTFENAFITTPLCCPSRASIFTGLYASNHGVHTNEDSLSKRTFVDVLHEHGYYTGLVGKYLNSWDPGTRRPEFDRWVEFARSKEAGGNETKSRKAKSSYYIDPRVNVDGVWSKHPGYLTYILRDYAVDFLRKAAQQQKPFMLVFAPFAPHGPADPAPEDKRLYASLAPHRPPSFNEEDLSDKPAWLRVGRPAKVSPATMDEFRLKQIRSLKSLDRAIEDIVNELKATGALDNTVIIYISDNGIQWGEHRLTKKSFVYEESIHVPMAIRFPVLAAQKRTEKRVVANIDIAPTIYELASVTKPGKVDGRSLVPLVKGETVDWRDEILIESWPTNYPAFVALRTNRYVYVETVGDIPELYDLHKDPYQLQNQVDNASYRPMRDKLRKQLKQYRNINAYAGPGLARLDRWGD